jgi:hypothetical protein
MHRDFAIRSSAAGQRRDADEMSLNRQHFLEKVEVIEPRQHTSINARADVHE